MTETKEHIIGKFSLGFDIRSGPFEVENWEDLAIYSEKHLIPILENNLNKLEIADTIITIDKMELELDLSFSEDWENSLNKSFDLALAQELAKLSSSPSPQTGKPIRVPELAALYHFLEQGSFPWFYTTKSAWDFENACHKNLDLQAGTQLIDHLLIKPVHVKRLLEIFSDTFLHELTNVTTVSLKRIPGVEHLRKAFREANVPEIPKGVFRNLYWSGLLNISQTIIKSETIGLRQLIVFILQRDVSGPQKGTSGTIAMPGPTISDKKIPSHLEHLWPWLIRIEESLRTDKRKKHTRPQKQRKEQTKISESSDKLDYQALISGIETLPNMPAKSVANNTAVHDDTNSAEPHVVPTNTTSDSEDVLYVDHAGIVLVHPFLELFFNKLKLLQDGQWSSPACAEKAVQLLAYLATGKTFCPEYEMVLFKCLCGLPLDTFIGSRLDLSEKEIRQADKLLFAIIGHWEVLKGSSLEGLRTGFFHREGKLSYREECWRLQVEQKAQDILLSRLSWGLNVVKFPWLPNMLLVVWA